MKPNEIEYVLSESLKESLSVAEITGRPLLIKGEPGTGKTLLANAIAEKKGIPLFEWHVKSTSVAKDGLYTYDALARLNDARFLEGEERKKLEDLGNYIKLEGMGQAISYQKECVLLIDEIDKADIEFPNDLLRELDRMEFEIPETSRVIKTQTRPLVIITSNNEKELPDAFLRRCIFHYIEFPDRELMKEIIRAHFPNIENQFLTQSLELFYGIREINNLSKRPSTSELVDWISVLLHHSDGQSEQDKKRFLGSLLKNEKDLELLKRSRW